MPLIINHKRYPAGGTLDALRGTGRLLPLHGGIIAVGEGLALVLRGVA